MNFNLLNNFFRKIANILRFLSFLTLGLLPLFITIDVLARFFNIVLIGAVEVETNLLLITSYCLLAFLQLDNRQMVIDFVYEKISPFFQNTADIIVHFLSFNILSLLAFQSFKSYLDSRGFLSDELRLPINIYYFFPFLGLSLAACISFFQFLSTFLIHYIEKHFKSIFFALFISVLILSFPFLYRFFSLDLSYYILGGIIFLLLFFLLFCKMPIAFAMCLVGAIGLIIARSPFAAMNYLGNTPYSAVAQNAFVALPMFTLMGALILYSGISKELFNCANTWIGKTSGGLGIASIAGCSVFASISGDSMSTAVTMGSVALPEMQKLNYDPKLATGVLAAGGTLGILIPPSAAFIIYGIVTETSISRLFIAGILPGFLLAFLFMLYVYYVAKKYPHRAPQGRIYTFSEKIRSLRGILPIFLLLILVLGGIMGGFFSPTEGGGVGVMGAFIYALLKRKVSLQNLFSSLEQAAVLTAKLMSIMVGVALLSYFFATTRLPFLLADFITSLPIHRFFILAIVIFMLIALGCMMNLIPMLTLIMPALFPSIIGLGFDPIWFGVICVIVIEMGQITPPVGLVVFALAGIDKNIPITDIFKGILPFFIIMLFAVFLLCIFPSIATFLPDLLLGESWF